MSLLQSLALEEVVQKGYGYTMHCPLENIIIYLCFGVWINALFMGLISVGRTTNNVHFHNVTCSSY